MYVNQLAYMLVEYEVILYIPAERECTRVLST